MGFLHGKRALIVGIASQRSIAWGIANAMHREGAQLAFTYQNERLRDRVDEAANAFGSNIVLPCDVSTDAEIDGMFAEQAASFNGMLDRMEHILRSQRQFSGTDKADESPRGYRAKERIGPGRHAVQSRRGAVVRMPLGQTRVDDEHSGGEAPR